MAINFGILQNTPAPTTQIVQTPNYAAQNEQQVSGVLEQIRAQRAQGMAEQAQKVQQQAQQQQMAASQQAMQFAAQNQPGVLAQQQASLAGSQAGTQGQLLQNQMTQGQLNAQQYAMALRQKASQAFQEGMAKGGTQGGVDAIGQTYLNNGDVDGYQKLVKTQQDMEDLKSKQSTNGVAGLTGIGDIVYSIHNAATPATPPQKDPTTGAIIPGKPAVTELQGYTQQYPTIKKLYPNAPSPGSFSSNDQFIDTFSTPVLATAGPVKAKQQADLKALTDDAQYKAHIVSQSAIQDLKTAVANYGANSQQAKDAAANVTQSQQAAANVSGGGLVDKLMHSITNPSAATVIKQYTSPSTPVTKATTAAVAAPTQAAAPTAQKVIGGTTYVQHNGEWYKQ